MTKDEAILNEIKKLDEEDFPVYMVMRKLKGSNRWEDTDSPAYTDYDDAVIFLDISRQLYPDYLYKIEEY